MSEKPEFEVYDKLTDEVRETVSSKYASKKRRDFWSGAKEREHAVRPKKKEA